MKIENNILKHYLQNAYFITGTAYAGKSTAVRMLAERYGLLACTENYHMAVSERIATPESHPDLCYNRSLTDWRDFVTRSPEEYERWIYAVGREAAEFEVAHLIAVSQGRRVIVDTNIPCDLLREISDERHVAVMLSPESMSVDRFFDRDDPDKRFLLDVIDSCDDPAAVLENYRMGLRRVSGRAHYDEYAESGFFTIVRKEDEGDTREAVCRALAEHFGFDR